jgi:acetyltransferase-like isoleucine patch superfamily enzyme
MTNPFDSGYLTEGELKNAGFKQLGQNVRIARNCTIIGLENIEIGDNVRVDGYSSIIAAGEGSLRLGSFIHIASYCLLSAGAGIVMEDFSGLSQGVRIYSRTDDYTGKHLTNPTVPVRFTGVVCGEVILKRHVIIGSGSVILPRVTIGEGSAVGTLSLVTKSLESWGVFFGSPARKLKNRSKDLLALETELYRELKSEPS